MMKSNTLKRSSKNVGSILFLTAITYSSCSLKNDEQSNNTKQSPPNIIIILADDMGYSDLACYGGEMKTPNLDQLAAEGIRFTQFYNASRSCPTRASLLTGLYPHQVGLGGMVFTSDERPDGPYQGYLTKNSVTIAEVLKTSGYYTAASGKWHVGEKRPNWPTDRGFDNYYGLISGASNYYDISRPKAANVKRYFAKDSVEYFPPEEDFYMTDALTENAIRFLEIAETKESPFFLYLPYTAPHWPLHAKQEDIEKYRGTFTEGWDVLREKRYARMIEMGIIDKGWNLSERDPQVTPWNELDEEQKDRMNLLMSIYAAQIDCMDQGIGKVLNQIDKMEVAENTIVLFLSDNGASAEYDPFGRDFWGNFWDGEAVPGSADSYHSYGGSWANLSNTPYRKYKKRTHEGGIATPLIVRWPAKIPNKGSICHEPGHVIDIMATICDITGSEYPETFRENSIIPLQGKPFTNLLLGKEQQNNGPYFWEHLGNRAVLKENWKLVSLKDKSWELYNLKTDRSETINLIEEEQETAKQLQILYDEWAKNVGVE